MIIICHFYFSINNIQISTFYTKNKRTSQFEKYECTYFLELLSLISCHEATAAMITLAIQYSGLWNMKFLSCSFAKINVGNILMPIKAKKVMIPRNIFFIVCFSPFNAYFKFLILILYHIFACNQAQFIKLSCQMLHDIRLLLIDIYNLSFFATIRFQTCGNS